MDFHQASEETKKAYRRAMKKEGWQGLADAEMNHPFAEWVKETSMARYLNKVA